MKEKIKNLNKEMKDYKSEMNKMEEKLSIMKKKYNKMNYRYDKDIDRISLIMSNVETKVVKELGLPEYKYPPVLPVYGRKYSIKSINETLNLRVLIYVGEGQYHGFSVKIPLQYFDMTDKEIEVAHTKWSTDLLLKRVEINAKIERNDKLNKFNK